MSSDEMPNAEQLREVFWVRSASVPRLGTNLTKVLYEAQAGGVWQGGGQLL